MKNEKKINDPFILMLAIVAMLITITGSLFKQKLINMLPLYISLLVSWMQSRVSRVAYLLGALNSILYTIVYIHLKLYATAVYALLFSFTIQLATYFMWKRNAQGEATKFRVMKWWQRLLAISGFATVWVVAYKFLTVTDSGYQVLDVSVSLLGILTSILTMMAYIEYVPLMILSTTSSIILYIFMIQDNPAQITFLIYTVYSLVCQMRALKRVLTFYRCQNDNSVL